MTPTTTRFFTLFLIVVAISGCSSVPEYKIARKPDIATTVLVVDEHDRPIISAEVWRVAVPAPGQRTYMSKGISTPSSDYVIRVMKRYADVAEFASYSGPGFINPLPNPILTPGFHSLDPTDSSGHTKEVIKYETGRGAAVTLTYAAMSYCYIPAAANEVVNKEERGLKVKIVLKRDMACVLPSAPYWTKYQQIRWKFSSGNWLEGEAELAREELVAAAQAAETSGDRKIAARIYSWIPYLPTATYFANKSDSIAISGYTREDERSARNIDLLEKAASLDPDNRYIQMKLLLLRPPATRNLRIKALEELCASGRDDLWPQVYVYLENEYYAAGLKDKSFQQFLRFKELEPDDYRNQTGFYKWRLARHIAFDEFKKEFVIEDDLNKKDEYGHAPIYYAIRAGRVDIFDWLSSKGGSVPSTALAQAVVSRRPEMVRRILQGHSGEDSNPGDMPRHIRSVDDILQYGPEDVEDLIDIRRMLLTGGTSNTPTH